MDGMAGSSRVLSVLRYLRSEEDKMRLKNAQQSYPALIDLADTYDQGREHGTITHSILNMLVKSSPDDLQSFSPLAVPDERALEGGHNSYFLTDFTKLGGLSVTSRFLRENLGPGGLYEFVRSHRFNLLNQGLMKLVSVKDLRSFLVEFNRDSRAINSYKNFVDKMINYAVDSKEVLAPAIQDRLLRGVYHLGVVLSVIPSQMGQQIFSLILPPLIASGEFASQILDVLLKNPKKLESLIIEFDRLMLSIVDRLTIDDDLSRNSTYRKCLIKQDWSCSERIFEQVLEDTREERALAKRQIIDLVTPVADYSNQQSPLWDSGRYLFDFLVAGNVGGDQERSPLEKIFNFSYKIFDQFQKSEANSMKGFFHSFGKIVSDQRIQLSAIEDWIRVTNQRFKDGEKNIYYGENTKLLDYAASWYVPADRRRIGHGLDILFNAAYYDSIEFFQGILNNISFVRPPLLPVQ